MKRAAAIASIAALTAFVTAGLSEAGHTSLAHSLSATMTPGQVVTPKNKPARFPESVMKARGTFTGTTSANGRTLKWRLSYSNLGQANVVIADVHIGKPGKFGPILLRICGPCTAGQTGTKKLKAGYAQQLASGSHWLTLITNKYPNGIVRGQIKVK